ncbi:MAG: ACP phosphodiesterase [Halofilum sp. (in: g-proteobacteria)]|nr:ACP phosphodiesterase [Halofilum sp. (in: g-proteobacteria)]
MNYLAHLCLSDGSPDSILGNFLGDFVKGRPEGRYTNAVVRGIRLHRAVDTYTDAHPAVCRAVARVDASRRRYAGIAVDMAFDHFLARQWQNDDAAGFAALRRHAYAVLRAREDSLPLRLQRILPSLAGDDWLASYAELDGVCLALERMSRRLSRANPLAHTADDIERHYHALQDDFEAFWPDARAFAAAEQRRLARSLPGG